MDESAQRELRSLQDAIKCRREVLRPQQVYTGFNYVWNDCVSESAATQYRIV